MTIEGLRLEIRKKLIQISSKKRNNKLAGKDFTIISNNCWGRIVYESFNLEKLSPTVGLFFMADEYIKFLKKFPDILNKRLEFIEPQQSKYTEYLKLDDRFGSYPIGVLDGVEICFLHYHSKEEAEDKWYRRCKRVNLDKLIVKINDQNLCTEEHLKQFSKLPFMNKLIFSAKELDFESLVWIKEARRQSSVHASQEPVILTRYMDVTKYINSLYNGAE